MQSELLFWVLFVGMWMLTIGTIVAVKMGHDLLAAIFLGCIPFVVFASVRAISKG